MPISGDFYTRKELQEILGVSRQRIGNLAMEHKWYSPLSGLYHAGDVDAYLAARQRAALARQVGWTGGKGQPLLWDDTWDTTCPVCGASAVQEPPTDASGKPTPWVCEQGHGSRVYAARAVRKLLGVSKQRVSILAAKHNWHRPSYGLYDADEIDAYLAARNNA